jgi:hypothetical protein
MTGAGVSRLTCHNVVALRLEPLGQVAAGNKGEGVSQGTSARFMQTGFNLWLDPHLAMKPPAPVMQMRSFFSGQ